MYPSGQSHAHTSQNLCGLLESLGPPGRRAAKAVRDAKILSTLEGFCDGFQLGLIFGVLLWQPVEVIDPQKLGPQPQLLGITCGLGMPFLGIALKCRII